MCTRTWTWMCLSVHWTTFRLAYVKVNVLLEMKVLQHPVTTKRYMYSVLTGHKVAFCFCVLFGEQIVYLHSLSWLLTGAKFIGEKTFCWSRFQEEPLPHELRPVAVLKMTMDYLATTIMDQVEGREGEWFDFVWNRTRGIRKVETNSNVPYFNTTASVSSFICQIKSYNIETESICKIANTVDYITYNTAQHLHVHLYWILQQKTN